MRTVILLIAMLALPGTSSAADAAFVPWEEFKVLYKESIERRIAESTAKPEQDRKLQTHTIDEAVYRLIIGTHSTQGEVLLSGRVVSGGPDPIPLFGDDVIVSGVNRISGGSLIVATTDSRKIQFLPDGSTKDFQVGVSFMVNQREDNRSKIVGFAIPAALRNSLQLTLTSNTQLIETPGIVDAEGVHRFSLLECLSLRYVERDDLTSVSPVDVDTFSRVQPQGRRLIVTTYCVPLHPASQPLALRLQPGAQFLSSSLKPSWIRKRPDNTYEIRLPANEQRNFSIQFAVEESQAGVFVFHLPTIEDNNGREGDFVLEEPDDVQISVSAESPILSRPAVRLGEALLPFAGKQTATMHITPGDPIRLDLKRFQTVAASPIVLDSQYFFASFEETGGVLCVLVMDLPAETGPRISLTPVPEARIWSLKVNDEFRKLYTDEEDAWVIPLKEGTTSHVELAMLLKGEKLGLQGRLEATLPETGLAARKLCVGIALPERVQLIAIEGPVNPAPGESWTFPDDFIGKPHLFSRSFHKGEGMKLVISYKEPVKK